MRPVLLKRGWRYGISDSQREPANDHVEAQFLIGLRVVCGLLGQARSIEEESFSQKIAAWRSHNHEGSGLGKPEDWSGVLARSAKSMGAKRPAWAGRPMSHRATQH
jgi:hypothetical protein